jgi:hypothetical protein
LGLWSSSDFGQNWELKKILVNNKYYWANYGSNYMDDQGNFLLFSGDSISFSNNFGQTFSTKKLLDDTEQYIHGTFYNSITNTILASTKKGTIRSTNLGESWNYVTDSLFLSSIQIHPSGTLFGIFQKYIASQFFGTLQKSIDDGQTWTFLRDSINSFIINDDGNVLAFGEYGSMVFKSIDLGETWSLQPGGGYDVMKKGNLLCSYGRVSTDEGKNWNNPPVLPSNFSASCFDLDDNYRVYIGGYQHLFRSKNSVLNGTTLTGHIRKDADADCDTPDATEPIKNWIVKAQNNTDTWFANTDSLGVYRMFVDTGAYEVSIRPPLVHLLWEPCEDTLQVDLPELLDTTSADFVVEALADCPFLGVDLAIAEIAPCFETTGSVSWCNYGSVTADTAYVDLTLDPLLALTYISLPYDSLGGGVWRVQLGQIEAGECGSFWFIFIADCDSTVVGQAVCLDVKIHPDSLCMPIPGWSGALLKVTATCPNDTTLNFEIKNIGDMPSQPLDYIVVEDDLPAFGNQKRANCSPRRPFLSPRDNAGTGVSARAFRLRFFDKLRCSDGFTLCFMV